MDLKTFNEITDFYWEHRDFYFYFDENFVPDYPDYACLPVKLNCKMSCEAVDALQDIWQEVFGPLELVKTKSKFKSLFKRRLRELGEVIK
jgi:hypothetical protein